MAGAELTSMQRVLTALAHKEPDRAPLFLLVTMHGAKELGLSIKDYFSKAEHVAEGQLRMQAKYGHDCLYPFFYAAVEVEAWGAEVIYHDDGPPNSGRPFIRRADQIPELAPPVVKEQECLQKVLKAIEMLKRRVGDEIPIIGVVMSPFSLPVMQMGFDAYIELIYRRPELFDALMRINEDFCVSWANAQLQAGASAICYFDPVSSPTITPRDLYLKTGFEAARRTLARIQGPTATHLASGASLPILDDLPQTGTAIVGVSADEDIAAVKRACKGKLSVLGNLNGLEMRRWSPQQAEAAVRAVIAKAGAGGGFLLSDNHGEIPWQTPDEVLSAIADAARRWGEYPLTWVGRDAE
jgi:uroporphyrinogen decarboxylase